jgi:sporulation protein YlmC with PRC-barrel domain
MADTDFHPGAAVYSADGTHVGSLHRVIIDAESLDLHSLVVQETRRFSGHLFAPGTALLTDDVIVPLDRVRTVSHSRVDLSSTAAELRLMEPYLSYAYAARDKGDGWRMAVAGFAFTPFIRPLIESAQKADSELEIRHGENVMLGKTGRRLGTVQDVLFDGAEFVAIVMRPDHILAENVILQVRFLDRGDDLALFARLSEDDLKNLPVFHPEG